MKIFCFDISGLNSLGAWCQAVSLHAAPAEFEPAVNFQWSILIPKRRSGGRELPCQRPGPQKAKRADRRRPSVALPATPSRLGRRFTFKTGHMFYDKSRTRRNLIWQRLKKDCSSHGHQPLAQWCHLAKWSSCSRPWFCQLNFVPNQGNHPKHWQFSSLSDVAAHISLSLLVTVDSPYCGCGCWWHKIGATSRDLAMSCDFFFSLLFILQRFWGPDN